MRSLNGYLKIPQMLSLQTIIVLVALLAGCAVGPDYRSPQPELPDAWHGTPVAAPGQTANVDLSRWWTSFDDPILTRLINEATAKNFDLRIAAGRLREARARLRNANVALLPFGEATGKAMHQRTSENGPQGHKPEMNPEGNLFEAGFDASWELDFFGGARRGVEEAVAEAQAAEDGRQDVLVSLLAEVGRAYVQLRSLQQRLSLAQKNLGTQTDTLRLVRVRFDAGLATDLDVAQAEALASSTASQIPALETQTEQTIYRISILTGHEPAALIPELSREASVPEHAVMAGVPLGLPSDLLRQRPDIRAAERRLAAATARVGVAVADLYPHFFLTGGAGFQSLESPDLFFTPSRFFSIGPSIRWSVLDFGRVRSNIGVQDARVEQALATYEKSILIALGDVESSLTALDKETTRRQALSQTVAANRRAVALSFDLYREGLATYLAVLDSQRQLFLAEDQLAQSDAAMVLNRIGLYKALGGGWEE